MMHVKQDNVCHTLAVTVSELDHHPFPCASHGFLQNGTAEHLNQFAMHFKPPQAWTDWNLTAFYTPVADKNKTRQLYKSWTYFTQVQSIMAA